MDINWLSRFAESWLEQARQGRLPHAVLLAGPRGTGKRAAAAWIAARRLGVGRAMDLPQYPVTTPEHADLHWIAPPEDKQSIGIEQVRDLVSELGLTSYSGNGKVAVIVPADAMTLSAANSLLKTLEEPPGDSMLILIADRPGMLPATVLSRCQRIGFLPPAEAESLAWLERVRSDVSWQPALRLAGSAPLAAIEALDSLDRNATMSRDFAAVVQGSSSPVDVAGRWADAADPAATLDWLARQVQELVRSRCLGAPGPVAQGIDESVFRRMDSRNLFCYLDTINSLRAQPAGSFNARLALESLLIDLSTGLLGSGQGVPDDGMRHMVGKRAS